MRPRLCTQIEQTEHSREHDRRLEDGRDAKRQCITFGVHDGLESSPPMFVSNWVATEVAHRYEPVKTSHGVYNAT